MDEEQLILLKRWASRSPKNRVDLLAKEYGISPKEMKERLIWLLRDLIKEYEKDKIGLSS